MTDKATAIRALIAKVEAGDPMDYSLAQDATGYAKTVTEAHYGSLDAAKRLHDAVLPGWHWDITHHPSQAFIQLDRVGLGAGVFWAEAEPPARAWLLAILKALLAKEEAQ